MHVMYMQGIVYQTTVCMFVYRALKPPEWKKQWHCAVRVSSNKKLVGFISAVPATIKIFDT